MLPEGYSETSSKACLGALNNTTKLESSKDAAPVALLRYSIFAAQRLRRESGKRKAVSQEKEA